MHGRFYLLASNYYRQQGKHAEYYRTALRYLGCVNLDDLSFKEQMQHAFFLGLAALLGEGVYNLGELVSDVLAHECAYLTVLLPYTSFFPPACPSSPADHEKYS